MKQYFKNFKERIGEVYVKPCSENLDAPFVSHGDLYKNPKTEKFMITFNGVNHRARCTNSTCGYIFSHKRKEYYAELEHEY